MSIKLEVLSITGGGPPGGGLVNVPPTAPSFVLLPAAGSFDGAMIETVDTHTIYVWDAGNALWQKSAGNFSLAANQANGTTAGFLSSTDWTTFNNKQNLLVRNNVSSSTPGMSIGNGTSTIIGSAPVTVDMQAGSTASDGYLTSTAYNLFNNKQDAVKIGPFSYTSYAQGVTLFGPTFQLGVADATNPGGVGTTAQSFAGNKTFLGFVQSSIFNLAGASSGFVANITGTSFIGYTLSWPTAQGATTTVLQNNGTGGLSWRPFTNPTIQKFTSGSGTYTTPTNPVPIYLRLRMVGGGGGSSGSGTASSGTEGGAGGPSTFGTAGAFGSAGGGAGGTFGAFPAGAGGAVSLGSSVGIAIVGGSGGAYMTGSVAGTQSMGAPGGMSAFGGGGGAGTNGGGAAGAAGATNSGGGAGAPGGGANASALSGNSGAAGGYIDAIITSPTTSYAYAVGAGGSAGTAGTGGSAGGIGGSGLVIVEEHYQ